jgi:hypothetical protein
VPEGMWSCIQDEGSLEQCVRILPPWWAMVRRATVVGGGPPLEGGAGGGALEAP